MSKAYNVLLFGSHPDQENDDCWTGADFDTLAEAEAFYLDPLAVAKREGLRGIEANWSSTAFLMLDGPDVNKVRQVGRVRRDEPDTLWENERRMQAAMMGEF